MSDPVSPWIIWASAAATAASGAVAAKSSSNAGKAQEIAYKQEAKQEEMAAADREIERRRNLVRALSSQNVEAGALGLDPTSGSRRAIALDSAEAANRDSLTDRAMTSRGAVNLRSRGRFARRGGNIQAAGTLFDTAGRTLGSL